jgi:chorismate-pyruvate lyase
MMRYNLLPLTDWLEPDKFKNLYKNPSLDKRVDFILCSDCSLTGLLEEINETPIELELIHQENVAANGEVACLLGIEERETVLKREAWLKVKEGRLVFAHSVIPLRNLNKELIDELEAGDKPLGYIFETFGITVNRSDIKISTLKCNQIAEDILYPVNHAFWARKYNLISKERIQAVITEVFSPAVFEFKDNRKIYGECFQS